LLVLGIVAAVQVTVAAANGLSVHSVPLLKIEENLGYLRQPFVGVDPNGPVLDGILHLGITHGNVSAYSYCYRDYDHCERDNYPPFEPTALSTLARERRVPLFFHFIGDLDFSNRETLSKQVDVRDFQYVLVDMFDAPGEINHADPYVIHTKQFISMERESLPQGLLNRGCFSVNRPICLIEVAR
jgi:hypothetical protein